MERAFAVSWHDRASALDMEYSTSRVSFHAGRWSARVSVRNGTDKPMYEAAWSPPGSSFAWNGPALVFDGVDVLGNRRLIYLAADSESPRLPVPLQPGARWAGTIGGALPDKPELPRGKPIWVRYPMFGVGEPWDGLTTTSAVQWLSEQSVQL